MFQKSEDNYILKKINKKISAEKMVFLMWNLIVFKLRYPITKSHDLIL